MNIASRMESHGQSKAIQITHATYDLIKDDFVCETCGTIDIKGSGEMEVWHILSEKSDGTRIGAGASYKAVAQRDACPRDIKAARTFPSEYRSKRFVMKAAGAV